jgi:hypothetical protein
VGSRSKQSKAPVYRMRDEGRLRTALRRREVWIPLLVVGVPLTCLLLWTLRVLWRPVFMLFVIRHPALLTLPIIAAISGFGVHVLVRHLGDGRTRARRDIRRPLRTALVAATLALMFAGVMTGFWTKAALYEYTTYSDLDLASLDSGQVRIKPYAVAIQQTQNGLNSPTEHPSNMHIVKVDGRIAWTSVRDPEGVFRVFAKPTRGVMSVAAGSSMPDARIAGPTHDATFAAGPGMQIRDNIRWRLYKRRCFTCDVAEIIGLPTVDGPLLVAPYVRYEGGWFVRRPVFGGVYVVHPDGRIDDLSPEQAARDPLLRGTGRIFPEKLARQIAEAYALKKGVINRLFAHEEELHVADTESNRQPFLEDFARIGTQWVTTMKPRGRTFTTSAIMAIDAVTGNARIWHVPKDSSLIGNERALDIVRGGQFPGIVFAPADATAVRGRFRVIEPRQVFRDGRLYFLCSIIPDGGSRITLSVLVDAGTQQIAGSFPATPKGDADLIAFLHGGAPAGGDDEAETPEEAPEEPDAPAAPAGGGPSAVDTLRRLLRENRAEQAANDRRSTQLEAQERDLQRLLETAREEAER